LKSGVLFGQLKVKVSLSSSVTVHIRIGFSRQSLVEVEVKSMSKSISD